MRKLLVGLIALVVLVACGPSGKEVAKAKQARYQGDKLTLFAAVKAATESKYKLQKSDETALGMQTVGRWYSPDGLAVSASTDDVRDLVDQSVNLALVVELLPADDNWVVGVRPIMMRFNKGQPKPEPLDVKNPSVPGWVHGKIDQLQFAIYERMKQYEVKGVGGIAPGPTPPPGPAPMPDEGAGAGSAEPSDPAAPTMPAPTTPP
ncbi:MAG: hypothetical protein H0T89_02060 [Deltaproteobacteria bacterium]|nr:hypothetical protein [Deltaproteobacteria bacterium]MDQ3298003.1 hypothetical protein [Myxococcota bacterium]